MTYWPPKGYISYPSTLEARLSAWIPGVGYADIWSIALGFSQILFFWKKSHWHQWGRWNLGTNTGSK
jgi:hypothetical protein